MKAHGPYRHGNKWRLVVMAPGNSRQRRNVSFATREEAIAAKGGDVVAVAMRPGFVYFVQEGHRRAAIKIGWAKDVKKRIVALQTATPHPLRLLHFEPGTRMEERAFHARFAAFRLGRTEWFAAVGVVPYLRERLWEP